MRKFFTFFSALFSICVFICQDSIFRVEPPNWWTGMVHNEIQLLCYGNNLANCDFKIGQIHNDVHLKAITKTSNPNYVFIDIKILNNADPQNINLEFSKNGDLFKSFDFPIYKKDSSGRNGFNQKDVLYLITPDRFVNGNPENDDIPYLKERPERENIWGRHGGDIEGIIQSLDYISEMGFTAIWINPLLENDMKKSSYHGYSTTDYYKIDPRFGTNSLYKTLCSVAKEKNIKIVMDMITNHSGSEHWFVKDPPTKDWINFEGKYTQTSHAHYSVQDPYASKYDKKAFVDGWFVETMPDLNQNNKMMANYLIQNTLWWIEYSGISGIRMDTYPYNDKEFINDWSCAVKKEYPNFMSVGEEYPKFPHAATLSYWQEGKKNYDNYSSCLPSVLDIALMESFINSIKDLKEKDKWKTWQEVYYMLSNDFLYPDPYKLVVFPDNHDTKRIFSTLNEDFNKFKMTMVFFSTIRGIPHFYYGDEILMTNIKGNNDGGTRSDFPGGWKGDKINGFNGKGLTQQQKEAQEFVKKLLNWRKTKNVIHYGKLMQFTPYSNGIYSYFRYDENDVVMVIFNSKDKSEIIQLDRYEEIISGYKFAFDILEEKQYILENNFVIKPNSVLVLELKK